MIVAFLTPVTVGMAVGLLLGAAVGDLVGLVVGSAVGLVVGAVVGDLVFLDTNRNSNTTMIVYIVKFILK